MIDAEESIQAMLRMRAEIERLRTVLEVIAGRRQCVDNLMSNVEIARRALEQKADTK